MLTTDELDDVVSALRSVRTDTSDVEAKRAQQDVPRDLKETLSSFSNTRWTSEAVRHERTAGQLEHHLETIHHQTIT